MNPNANAWTPNAGASAFVPSWAPAPPAPAPAPAPSPPSADVADAWDDDDGNEASVAVESEPAPVAEPVPAPVAEPVPEDGKADRGAAGEARDAKEERLHKLEPSTAEPLGGDAEVTALPTSVAPGDAGAGASAVADEQYVEGCGEEEESDDEPPRELGDHRKHVNVVFIGHVDAGKSTLCGQIMWLSGNIDDRTLQKYADDAKAQNRESWKFAYAMDTNEEERAKGKTVEVGRSFFATENKRFTVLDAPGHKNFVPHMIGGASQADIGVLVIAARKGEFETGFEKGGQTREHITLAKTAGVKQLVVVINKMDDKTVEWSQDRYDECVSKLSPFMKESGFRPKKDCYWLPVSALSGANIAEPLTDDVCPWFSGKSLLQTLDEMEPPERLLNCAARLPIMDKYNDMGTVVMGKLQSGVINKGDKCIICPIQMECSVIEIDRHGAKSSSAEPGDNVKLKLGGVDDWEQIESGFMLCHRATPMPFTTTFVAQVKIHESKSIICPGFSCVLHIHSVVEDVTITKLLAMADKSGKPIKSKKAVKFVRQGDMVYARLTVPRAICVETFKDFEQFGRFMLRDEGKTIGMGVIKSLG